MCVFMYVRVCVRACVSVDICVCVFVCVCVFRAKTKNKFDLDPQPRDLDLISSFKQQQSNLPRYVLFYLRHGHTYPSNISTFQVTRSFSLRLSKRLAVFLSNTQLRISTQGEASCVTVKVKSKLDRAKKIYTSYKAG